MNSAKNLTNFTRFVYWNFRFLSSVEDRKSMNIPGTTRA